MKELVSALVPDVLCAALGVVDTSGLLVWPAILSDKVRGDLGA